MFSELEVLLLPNQVGLLEVGVLEDQPAAKLVSAIAGGGKLPADVMSFILRHCQGIPLRLEQMASSLVSSNLLFLTDSGDFELEGKMEDLSLPTSLQESIRLRLAPSCVAKHTVWLRRALVFVERF